MSKLALKVMTITIAESVAKKFEERINDLNLRRDAYLAERLRDEVELLAELPIISDLAISYLRLKEQSRDVSKVKIGIKLPGDLIASINTVCKEKKVPRDLFIETFLNYLANGNRDSEDVFKDIPSPLVMARAYLEDPYRDLDGNINIYKKRFYRPDTLLEWLLDENTDSNKNSSGKNEAAK